MSPLDKLIKEAEAFYSDMDSYQPGQWMLSSLENDRQIAEMENLPFFGIF